jgi:hypothetical protein
MRRLSVALGVYLLSAAALVAMQRTPGLRAFMAALAAAVLGWLGSSLLERMAGGPAARGGDAEESTSQELRRLRPRGQWTIIDAVEFEGMDVDHVALGPSGVYAVETKWTSAELDGVADLGAERWQRALDQSHRGARKIRLLLRSHGVHAQVRPVLVLWGPALVDPPEGSAVVDDVLVCWGRLAKLWRGRLEAVDVEEQVGPARAAMQRYVDSRATV